VFITPYRRNAAKFITLTMAKNLPMELISEIIMWKQSPPHAAIIKQANTPHYFYWPNGEKKYRLYVDAEMRNNRVGGPALEGWDQTGTKVLEEWFIKGKLHRKFGAAKTLFDEDGIAWHMSHFLNDVLHEDPHLQGSTSYEVPDKQVWSPTFERWVYGIQAIHSNTRVLVSDPTGKQYDVPPADLELLS